MLRSRRVSASSVALLLATLVAARTLDAQVILGPGENAQTAPRGVIRASILVDLARYDERFDLDGNAEPLGRDFSLAALDSRRLPSLLPIERRLQDLVGPTRVRLALGGIEVTSDVQVTTIPLQAEFGAMRRLTLFAMMPIVRTRNTVSLATPDHPAGANVSTNPDRDASVPAAHTANVAVQSQLAAAQTALANLLAACRNDPSGPRCGVVLGDSNHAKALIDSAAAFAEGLAEVYGGTSTPGSPFVPLAGSILQASVEGRLDVLGYSFAQFMGGDDPITAKPFGALGPLTAAQAQSAFDSEFFDADPIRSVDRVGIGDIEVGAKLLLLDGVGAADAPRGRFALRVAVASLFRAGVAADDAAFNWFDIPSGDGQHDVEVRGYTDVFIGRHLWASFVARYAWQLPDQVLTRIPLAPNEVYTAKFQERIVNRDLGDFLELEARPRYAINDLLALSGVYLYRYKAQDIYTGVFEIPEEETSGLGPVTLDASTLSFETEAIEHRVGAGITFSSTSAFQRGKARLPLEISYVHLRSIRGFGGKTPKLQSDQLQMRLYVRLFGAPPRAR